MIFLTRLNRRPVIVNAELIRTVESNPDTTITMINGDRLIVREDVPTVVSRAIEHARTIRSMIPEAREAAAVRASAAFPTVPGTASMPLEAASGSASKSETLAAKAVGGSLRRRAAAGQA